MINASLNTWPDNPHLDNTYEAWRGNRVNAQGRFTSGLSHADSHLGQIEEVLHQAKGASESAPA
jgi:hypothetical protein